MTKIIKANLKDSDLIKLIYNGYDVEMKIGDFKTVTGIGSTSNSDYKIYRAILNQSGTSAPVATVLENTLGEDVVWAYDGVGLYTGTLAGAFPLLKTQRFIGSPQNIGDQIICIDDDVDGIYIEANANDVVVSVALTVIVYN